MKQSFIALLMLFGVTVYAQNLRYNIRFKYTKTQTVTQPSGTSASIGGQFDQNCASATQLLPASQTYVCANSTAQMSLTPNVGQQGITELLSSQTISLTGPGSNPGVNGAINSFDETGGGAVSLTTNSFQRGNHSGFGTQLNCYGGGDCQGADINVIAYGGLTAGADEGTEGIRSEVDQNRHWPSGTITSGGSTGAILLNTTATSPFNDQGYLMDISQPAGTATIIAVTGPAAHPGIHAGTLKVSGLNATASTAWGLMVPSTVTYASSPVGVYQNYVSATATMTIQSGAFTTGAMACAGNNFEYMQITGVGKVTGGTQSVTFRTRNGWDNATGNTNQAECMQGGSVIGEAFAATATLATYPVAYPLLGATNSTTLVYANCSAGQCNSINTSNFLPSYTGVSLFPYAEIIGTSNGATGAVQLAYNNVPFVSGDEVVGAQTAQLGLTGYHLNLYVGTPSIYNVTNDIIDTPENLGFSVNDIGLEPSNVYYSGFNEFPAYNAPTALIASQGNFQNWMLMNSTPPSGGCMICAYNNNAEGASFIGSVSGSNLTVTAMTSGFIMTNQELNGPGITKPCLIGTYSPGSGTRGGIGIYALGCAATVSSEVMTTTKGLYRVFQVKGSNGPELTYDATTKAAVLNVANGGGALNIPVTTTIPAVKVGSGTYAVYRCTMAGTLPIGALTVVPSDCGASVATSLSVN